MKQLMGQMEDKLPTPPYLIKTGTELPKIDKCVRWMVMEVFKHFTQQAILICMLLHQTCSQGKRRTTEVSGDNCHRSLHINNGLDFKVLGKGRIQIVSTEVFILENLHPKSTEFIYNSS
jgi:hypothetical protein